jgi:SAM-dependent methyltransferase
MPSSPKGSESIDRAAYALRATDLETASRQFRALVPWYTHFLRPWLSPDKNLPLLDLPCGSGKLLFALHTMGYTNIRGADIDPAQVAVALELGLPVQQLDAFELLEHETPGSAAGIFSLDFLEHLTPENALRFVRLAHRTLSANGLFICRTPSADGPFGSHDRYNDLTHKWALTSGAARQLFVLGGFAPAGVAILQEAPVPYKWQNIVRLFLFKATTALWGAWLELCGIGAPGVWTKSMWIVARRS